MIVTDSLQVSASATIDATVETDTDSFTIDYISDYSITFTKTGTDGNPLIEIQGSNDGVNFTNPFLDDDDLTPLIMELDNAVNSVRDSKFMFKYIRVNTKPNGTTTGTLKYDIIYWPNNG